jgi:formamidopyrimidine-DNA glycosylase
MAGGLVGRTVTSSDFRVPQHATADLSGRSVLAFDSYGKHMLTRFSGGLTLHTHFEMDGAWQLVGPGKALPRSFDDEVRLVLATDGPTAYALRMPGLELVPTDQESRVVGHLGPTCWARAGTRTRRCAGCCRPRAAAGRGAARPAQPGRHRQPVGGRDLLPARALPVDAGARRRPAAAVRLASG